MDTMSLHAIHHFKENRPAFYDNVQNNLLEGKEKSAKTCTFQFGKIKPLKISHLVHLYTQKY